jgi:site-specific DNA recombinase
MTGNPNHGRNYYRCKASPDYVHQHGIDHPPVLHLREDAITDSVDVFLHQELGGNRLTTNLRALADAQHRQIAGRDPGARDHEQLKVTLAECDAKLTQYRAALDAGGDPKVIVGWITETTAVRTATQALLTAKPTTGERTSDPRLRAGDRQHHEQRRGFRAPTVDVPRPPATHKEGRCQAKCWMVDRSAGSN